MQRPGGELASRPLHFIWIADCSTSMGSGGKMEALNEAIRSALPQMRRVAEENPNAEVLVRAVKFSSGAAWHVQEPVSIDDFQWQDLSPGGVTDMGKAFELLASALAIPPMSDRALPPVLVLITDGQPTDDFRGPLEELMKLPWGTKAVRLAIAIGKGANQRVLKEFIGNPSIPPLQAENAEQLTEYIRWVSTVVLQSASSPASQTETSTSKANVVMPDFPADFWDAVSVDDVW